MTGFLRIAVLVVLYIGATTAAPKPQSLSVVGTGFAFSVKEPGGWRGDTENAKRYSANVVFNERSTPREQTPAIIRVLVVDKADESIDRDLDADMAKYAAAHPSAKFVDFAVLHPAYRVVRKLFVIPGTSSEYVAYVNPGPARKLMFCVSMDKQRPEASPAELAAYRAVVASLTMISSVDNPGVPENQELVAALPASRWAH
jgi:hypothetical protein